VARRRDEAGVAAIVLALAVAFIIVPLGAYGVDLGMQRVARRDMQSLADVVALDLARHLDGTTDASTLLKEFNEGPESLVSQSVGRNTSAVGDHDDQKVVAQVGTTDPSKYGTDGYFTPITSGIPTAVRVTATTDVAFGLANALPGGGISKGSAARSSVATRSQPSVCFSAGSTLLTLDTTKSTLSPLLDHILTVDLKAVGYSGIVDLRNANVPLAGLMAQLGVGSVEDLATTNVTLSQLAVAEAKAIKANDPTADVSALQAIHLGVDDLALPLADILNITSGGPTAGLTGDVNAFDLLTSRILLADTNHAIDADVVVPGLSGVSLQVISPPKVACGSPTDDPKPIAEQAQIQLTVDAPLSAVDSLGLTGGSIHLVLKVGAGDATLTGLSCSPESATFDVHTGAAEIPADQGHIKLDVTLEKFMSFIPGLGSALKLALQLLGVDPVGLTASLGAELISDEVPDQTVTYPALPDMPDPVTVSGSDGNVLTLTATNVQLDTSSGGLGGVLGALLNSTLTAALGGVVQPVVNTVVSPLLSSAVDPLLTALGIQLGTTEVDMLSRPVCSGVRLIG